MVWFVEFGGPITLTGFVPLSMLSEQKATSRLNHRLPSPIFHRSETWLNFSRLSLVLWRMGAPKLKHFWGRHGGVGFVRGNNFRQDRTPHR